MKRLKYRKGRTQPLQQATLLAEHEAMHRTQIEGIIDMDRDMRISGIQKAKVYQKSSTHPSYQSTIACCVVNDQPVGNPKRKV
jgi:hypothetical protein